MCNASCCGICLFQAMAIMKHVQSRPCSIYEVYPSRAHSHKCLVVLLLLLLLLITMMMMMSGKPLQKHTLLYVVPPCFTLLHIAPPCDELPAKSLFKKKRLFFDVRQTSELGRSAAYSASQGSVRCRCQWTCSLCHHLSGMSPSCFALAAGQGLPTFARALGNASLQTLTIANCRLVSVLSMSPHPQCLTLPLKAAKQFFVLLPAAQAS